MHFRQNNPKLEAGSLRGRVSRSKGEREEDEREGGKEERVDKGGREGGWEEG